LYLYQVIKHTKADNDNNTGLNKLILYLKIYLWTSFFILLIVILITAFGISRFLGIFLFICLIFFTRLSLKKVTQSKSGTFSSFCIPLGLAMLPIILLVFQLLIDKPLTSWSRARAINNSSELIGEIERYKLKFGKYPLTLNAIWKDYETGIIGIEKYQYT
jgi:hypothetical protein